MADPEIPPKSAQNTSSWSRRWPRDYFDYLRKAGQVFRQQRVVLRIMKSYARAPLAKDCAQEACLQLMMYRYDLEIAPEPVPSPTTAWFEAVESALVRFATARQFKRAVISKVSEANGINEAIQDLELVDLEAPAIESGPHMVEEQLHWSKVVDTLRTLLLQQPETDESVLQVLDQLRRNARQFERSFRDVHDASRAEDVFRGESFQINHEPLLNSLIENFPSADWNMQKLRVAIAKLCRQWERLAQDLAAKGFPIFESFRVTTSSDMGSESNQTLASSCQGSANSKKRNIS